jgi:tetratricopeptide (TPR) repeat protein
LRTQKFIPLLVVAAGLLAYHNSFTRPFIFDDLSSIPENPTIRHLWPTWQALSPSATAMVGGRPVLNFSLAINYAFGGTSVRGYHALNLAIHILAALTLFGVVRRTLLQSALRERFGTVANGLALATAVLWTVHPLQTEAVTYVSQRAESLMGLFYLLTLYCFIRGTGSPRPELWFTLSIAACLLGMATKEVMVTAPLMVLLYDRTFVAGSFRAAWTQRRRLYVGLGGTWFLLGYLMTGLQHRGVGYGLGITWQAYTLTECQVVVKYLCLALWPHPLVFDYGTGVMIRHATEAMPYALILVLLAAGAVVGLKRSLAIGFIGAWFFVILAPTSSVVPVAYQPMAESRMYLPLAAVVMLGVSAVYALVGRRSVAVFGVLAILLGFFTSQRNEDYRSAISIWSDTVAKRPDDARAHNDLGVALAQADRLPEAIEQFDQVLRITPDDAEVHHNLGNALAQAGKFEEAIGQYKQALRLKPDDAKAHNNLGACLSRLGRAQEAFEHWKHALRIKPDYAEAHYNLGVALEQTGKVPEAVKHYEQAVRIKPDYTQAQNALARLQAGQ